MLKNLICKNTRILKQNQLIKFNFSNFQNNPAIPASLKSQDFLEKRHIGPNETQVQQMLDTLSLNSIEELISRVIPEHVRDPDSLNYKDETIPQALTESQMLEHMQKLAGKNQVNKTYIGEGFYNTHTPPVIQRNVFENPGWYTAYTPYQSEISQGRLENLMNFQTMVTELTGLDVSNASLLDEASAAAECVLLAQSITNNKRKNFFVSENAFPVTIDVIQTRANQLGINVIVGDEKSFDFEKNQVSGVLVQNPDKYGNIYDYTDLFAQVKKQKSVPMMAVDLLAQTLIKTPKEMGAEIAVGNSQRFGVPLGFGGPHAAWMACIDKHKRKLPGRIIGITQDTQGNPAYRMALQTREQHIKREKATSNICTAQALLANMAAFYAIYHGPQGLKQISQRINSLASLFASLMVQNGLNVQDFDAQNVQFFDTVRIQNVQAQQLQQYLNQNHSININTYGESDVTVSFDETTTLEDIFNLTRGIQSFQGQNQITEQDFQNSIQSYQLNQNLQRSSEFLNQEVFNSYHTETNMMRYLTYLERKDIGLNKSMIPLGSCTMKLNAASQLMPVSYPGFSQLHPYVPKEQHQGYTEMIEEFEKCLKIVTKFDAFSLQPNSGATGEYAGLLAIKGYQNSIGQGHRNICLIPTSAHGTNPASAILAGFKIVTINSDKGEVDLNDLKEKAEKHKDNLAAFMITYPSTFGVYEDPIRKSIDIIHENGGQVYMDGANMNAQIGYTSPGFLGADVCHLNLHKTFAIPHGGGGPGLGPIGVKSHLAPFLPGHKYSDGTGDRNVSVAQSHFSSASIIPISYSYIRQLGEQGLRRSTEIAILNANYILNKLKDHYNIVFTRNGYCAHELIIDIRPFKKQNILAKDIAKRLQDFSYHSPTVSFPIAETLMIEPTESEDIEELDRFIEALIQIRKEIQLIEDGTYSQEDNPLVNAPHTQQECVNSTWNHCYSQEIAAFPLPWVASRGKQWPTISRADEATGDRKFVGTFDKNTKVNF